MDDKVKRAVALYAAVIHHGLACLAEGAKPARPDTVVQTAILFEDHLDDIPYTRRT